MKLKYSLIALALLSMGAAQAVTSSSPLLPSDAATATAAGNAVYVSGSSALRFSLAAGFLEMCAPGTITVFGNTNGAAPGNNVRAYACTLATSIPGSFVAGTNVVFNKYDAGGSINGIQPLVLNTKLNYLSYTSCSPTGFVRTGAFDFTKVDYACAQGNSVVPQMGVSDVEATTIQNKTNLAAGVTAVSTTGLSGGKHSVAMGGVAVNLGLYRALQTAQGLTQDDAVADAPSIPLAWLTTLESGQVSPFGGTGFNALIPDDGTSTGSGNQAVMFCSRGNGSGTKAMHNAFLLSAPCSGVGLSGAGDNLASAPATEQGAGDWVLTENSSTGNVISCMQAANAAATASSPPQTSQGLNEFWAIGMVGAENDPAAGTSTDAGWRFVKVSGTYPNQANGQSGAYPMTYENFMYWPTTGLSTGIKAFANWLQTSAVTPIAISHATDVGTRNGILAIADITNPAYAGVTQYIARTTRGGSSCRPQVLTQ